jgi:hypothetical protein
MPGYIPALIASASRHHAGFLKKSPPAEKPDAEQQDQQAQASREKITELENPHPAFQLAATFLRIQT